MICISAAATKPTGYGDLAWQRWIGEAIIRSHRIPTALGDETFTAAGAPWVPQEWLFAVGTTILQNPFFAGLFEVGIGAAIAAAVGLASFRTWDRSRSNMSVSLTVMVIIAIIIPFESIRAQYLGWFFLSISLVIIEMGNARSMLALLLLSVLWANIHASVILLPILLTFRGISYAVDDKKFSPRAALTIALAIATLGCSWINPVGSRLTTFAFDMQNNATLSAQIIEWHQPTLANPIVSVVLVPLIIYGIAGTVARRKLWDLLLIGLFGYLSFHAQRNMALFAIAAVPAAIASFSPKRWPSDGRFINPIWSRRYIGTLTAVLATSTIFYLFFTPLHAREDDNVVYNRALNSALALPGKHCVFCQDFSWCSHFLGNPRFKVWWDGRADAYPAEVWREGSEINLNRPLNATERNLDRYAVDVVIAKEHSNVSDVLATSHWILVTDSQKYMVWQRARPASKSVTSQGS
jgi:hypothetical protein